MQYCSTRNKDYRVSDAEAIVKGLSPDGGLFVPMEIPTLTKTELEALCSMDYAARAAAIMERFLPSFTHDELLSLTKRAYALEKFPVPGTAPLVELNEQENILELFHGPTCAFKDFALQMLPLLLTASLKKTGVKEDVMILVATSGDTGKAALTGFADVEGTHICVFYPDGGVSNMQKLQMVTQSGNNVMVAAVKGNFDDTQNGVKSIFSDKAYAAELLKRGVRLSSANSINWGRLVPQIAYYVSAYCELRNRELTALGESVNVCVPTGNFGNILAAWFAKRMGLPIDRFICASNSNNVLTDFLQSGTYESRRPFYMTASPSMDIIISSNLERLLYLLCESDLELRSYMDALQKDGCYSVSPALLKKLKAEFSCGFCSEEETEKSIKATYEKYGYVADTHTAVALKVYEEYREKSGDRKKTIIAATASPFKFPKAVLKSLGALEGGDDFAMLDALSALAKSPAPKQLSELKEKKLRFSLVCEKEGMKKVISQYIGEKK